MFKFLLDFFESYSKGVSKFYYFYGKLVLPISTLLVKTLAVFYGLSASIGYQQNFWIVFFTSTFFQLIYLVYKKDLILISLYILSKVLLMYGLVLDKLFKIIIYFLSKNYYWVFLLIVWYFLIFLSSDYCLWFAKYTYFGYGHCIPLWHYILKLIIIFSLSLFYFLTLAFLILLNTLFEKDVFLNNNQNDRGRTFSEIYVFLVFHILDNFLDMNKSNTLSKKILQNIFKLKEIISLNKSSFSEESEILYFKMENRLSYDTVSKNFKLCEQEYLAVKKDSCLEIKNNKFLYYNFFSSFNTPLLHNEKYYIIRFKIMLIYGLFGISFLWFLTSNGNADYFFGGWPDQEGRSYPNSFYEPYRLFYFINV